MVKIIIQTNWGRITKVSIQTEGESGPACLLLTKKIQEWNPQATLEPTTEYYEDDSNLDLTDHVQA